MTDPGSPQIDRAPSEEAGPSDPTSRPVTTDPEKLRPRAGLVTGEGSGGSEDGSGGDCDVWGADFGRAGDPQDYWRRKAQPVTVTEGASEALPVAAALDPGAGPVAQLHRIADEDIGGNAPWLAEKLHAFAFQLAAEMRGECQLEVVQRTNAAEAKLERLRKFAGECQELAANGMFAYAAVATDILAITGSEGESDG